VAAATGAFGGGCCHHRQLKRPAFPDASQSQLSVMATSCPELLEQVRRGAGEDGDGITGFVCLWAGLRSLIYRSIDLILVNHLSSYVDDHYEQIFHYVRSRELRAVTLLGRAFKYQLVSEYRVDRCDRVVWWHWYLAFPRSIVSAYLPVHPITNCSESRALAILISAQHDTHTTFNRTARRFGGSSTFSASPRPLGSSRAGRSCTSRCVV
jgi:hypothetical protein